MLLFVCFLNLKVLVKQQTPGSLYIEAIYVVDMTRSVERCEVRNAIQMSYVSVCKKGLQKAQLLIGCIGCEGCLSAQQHITYYVLHIISPNANYTHTCTQCSYVEACCIIPPPPPPPHNIINTMFNQNNIKFFKLFPMNEWKLENYVALCVVFGVMEASLHTKIIN